MAETQTAQASEQEREKFKQKFSEVMRSEGEEKIANTLENNKLERIIEDDFINGLKNLTDEQKTLSWIETIQEKGKSVLGIKHEKEEFALEKYEHLNKTRLAQEMADFCIYQKKMNPTYIGVDKDKTKIYSYGKDTGQWSIFSDNRLGTICKEMSGQEYSAHLKREFQGNLRDHPKKLYRREMGLPDNEVLLNGKKVLNLDDLTLRDVEPEDYALYKLNVDYDEDADCPEFKDFIDFMLDEKDNQIKTLQEFMGWMLKFPNRDYKKALIILGVSNSGKSQLADIISNMFSEEGVQNLSLNQLGLKRRFHVNKLGDAIVNIDRDMSVSNLETTDTLKQLISQEKMSVEPKGDDSFVIDPLAKFFICSNVAPRPNNEDDSAFFNRFLTLKAPNAVPREDREPNYGDKLFEKEASGILNWMIDGLIRLEKQGGFTLEPNAYETKLMWNEYGNSVQRFLWECVEKADGDSYIPTSDLYEEYEKWIEGKMMEKKSMQKFSPLVEAQPYIFKTRRGVNNNQCFVGIKVDNPDSGSI